MRSNARPLDELADDLFAQARALMAWQDCDVTDVRTVRAISQCPTRCHEASVVVHEAPEHAVREDRLQVQRLLSPSGAARYSAESSFQSTLSMECFHSSATWSLLVKTSTSGCSAARESPTSTPRYVAARSSHFSPDGAR
jgi:hypothetical protein